jgi:PDZ domain-containing secreted protein
VDLKKGDKILMVNGKKIKTAKEVTTIYEALKTGEEFKMGISRDDKMQMVSFKKGDAKVKGVMHQEAIKMDGKSRNIFPTLELGFILEGKKDKLNIMKIMPGAPDFITKAKIAEGDQLIKVNKKPVKTVEQFTEEFAEIKTGQEMEITFLKNGKEITVSGKKPKSQGKVIIK